MVGGTSLMLLRGMHTRACDISTQNIGSAIADKPARGTTHNYGASPTTHSERAANKKRGRSV